MKQLFSWRHAILSSSLPPTTRHILLTLSCHMSDVGESCFPSIDTLANETGLSRKAVITHLRHAKESGWIRVGLHGFGGQKWKSHEYTVATPEGGEPSSPASEKAVNLIPEGGEPDAKKAVNDVHPNSTVLTLQGTLQEKLEAPVPAAAQKTDPQKRGSRLPADWTLPDDWRTWAQVERPDVDAGKEADKFRDYWHAKAGKDAAKVDWSATWRNWIRNARAGKQDAVAGRAVI